MDLFLYIAGGLSVTIAFGVFWFIYLEYETTKKRETVKVGSILNMSPVICDFINDIVDEVSEVYTSDHGISIKLKSGHIIPYDPMMLSISNKIEVLKGKVPRFYYGIDGVTLNKNKVLMRKYKILQDQMIQEQSKQSYKENQSMEQIMKVLKVGREGREE